MVFNVGWPEGIILALYALGILIAAANDGKPRNGKYSFPLTLCGAAAGIATLYWGGFFA